MPKPFAPRALILLSAALGAALGQDGCGDCIRLDSGAITGIVICDIIITILIALTAYFVSSKIQRRKQIERNKCQKSEMQTNDRTYEELQGPRTDVYNELGNLQN
uniref:TYRO protein tyrosine kinase-binding protein n=1 Tax=Leptobrachium leishanense TaxID=445787 RepID=A0A8C5QY29_9ANUR